MDNFQMGVLRNQKAVAKKLNAKATDTFGPTATEMYGGLFQGILGLRGLWWPGNVFSTGFVPDMSGQANQIVDNIPGAVNIRNGMTPIYPFNGTTQYLSGANAAWNQILGTEARIDATRRGLTFGGWFFNNSIAPANFKGVMGKWNDNAVNQRSYLIGQGINGHFQAFVSGNGTAQFTADAGVVSASNWHFIVARFTPSTELAIFVDYDIASGVKVANTTTIPAALFNCTADLEIATYDAAAVATSFFSGFYSLAFLACSALLDPHIVYLFNRSRLLFAV